MAKNVKEKTSEETKAVSDEDMKVATEEVEESPVAIMDEGEDDELTALKLMTATAGRGGHEARPGRFANRRRGTIHSVDSQTRVIDTAREEKRKAEISIYQSFVNKSILTGKIIAVKRSFDRNSESGKIHYYVVVLNGPYQVIIPVEHFADVSMEALCETYRQRDPNKTVEEATKIYLNSRLNAEIDYVISNIPKDGDLDEDMLVAGDRVEAMRRNRIHFWFGKTADGHFLLNVGDKAQARIISTAQSGIRIEIFGVETFIGYKELSWSMVADARQEFEVGDRVTVAITEINRNEEDNFSVKYTASVKQASADPRDEGMRTFTENGIYAGTIIFIRVPTAANPTARPGVFVKLADGVQCLCPFPYGPVAPVEGAKVVVTINKRDEARKYLYGKINHISKS